MLGLVAQPHAGLRPLGRLPAGGHFLAHLAEHGFELVRREIRIHHVDEIARDAVLLAQQRAARDLGRMRREYRLDQDRRERPLELVGVDALALQALADIDEAERLRHRRVAQVGAPTADPVHLLGHVDHLEVGGERANEIARGARLERPEQRLQVPVGGPVAFTMRDRELARRLDEVEQRLAALLAHELPDERPEPMHVLAQRTVLLREEDVGANRGRVGYGHEGRIRRRFYPTSRRPVLRRCTVRSLAPAYALLGASLTPVGGPDILPAHGRPARTSHFRSPLVARANSGAGSARVEDLKVVSRPCKPIFAVTEMGFLFFGPC